MTEFPYITKITCDEPGCQSFALSKIHESNRSLLRKALEAQGWTWVAVSLDLKTFCPEHGPEDANGT